MKLLKSILSLWLILAVLQLQAQTKLIAHKSHGGSNKTFYKACVKGSYNNSNFGLPSASYEIDSIVFCNDTTVTLFGKSLRYGLRDTSIIYKEYIYLARAKNKETLLMEVKKYIQGNYRYEETSNIVYSGFTSNAGPAQMMLNKKISKKKSQLYLFPLFSTNNKNSSINLNSFSQVTGLILLIFALVCYRQLRKNNAVLNSKAS